VFLEVYSFYFYFLFDYIAFGITSNPMVHCGSAFEAGVSGLPYYFTSVCVPAVIGALAVWQHHESLAMSFFLSFLGFADPT